MAAVTEIPEGDTKRLTGKFTVGTTDTDPTTVTFRIKDPSGTITVYVYLTNSELVKDSAGNFHVDWKFSLSGDYYYRWEGSGATAPGEKEFRVHSLKSEILTT